MKWLDKLLNKQAPVDLDRDGKIETIGQEVDGLVESFKRVFDGVAKKTENLHELIHEAEEVIIKAESDIDKAKEQIEKNNRITQKLKDLF